MWGGEAPIDHQMPIFRLGWPQRERWYHASFLYIAPDDLDILESLEDDEDESDEETEEQDDNPEDYMLGEEEAS